MWLHCNSLSLGCDCLGAIHYFDGQLALPNGELLQQQNVVCMHEVDDGLAMKHTNYRTNNPYVVRRRTLVLQTIITVDNYEYIFLWHFDQTGAISFEVRATGVLSVSPIDAGKTSPYGNIVSRGVLGTNHQHIFSVRVDPRIDGDGNTVHYEDSVTMPFDTEEDRLINPHGVGYTVERTCLPTRAVPTWIPSRIALSRSPTRTRSTLFLRSPSGTSFTCPPLNFCWPTPSRLLTREPSLLATTSG